MSEKMLRLPWMDSQGSGMRGDGLRFGWRSLVGAVLLGLLILHGFDASFVVDGYTMGIAGLLVVMALSGELESARVGGFEVKFRQALLNRLEREVDAVVVEGGVKRDSAEDEEEGAPSEEAIVPSPDLRSAAMIDPASAVIAFFAELEKAVDALFLPLARDREEDATIGRKVNALARFGVISASEARVVLDLVALRDDYAHGRGVDPGEAARLVAVGARLLPSFARARRNLGRAFEDLVGQELANVGGLRYERQPSARVPGEIWMRRPDFVVTAPVQIVIEAKVITEGANLIKRSAELERLAAQFPDAETILVIPWAGRALVDRHQEESGFRIVPIDHLKPLLEQLVSQ